MSHTMTFTPALSPGFARAQKLSRIMAVLFSIGFWLTLLGAAVMLAIPFIPEGVHAIAELGGISVGAPPSHDAVGLNDIRISLDGLSIGQRLCVLLAMEMVLLPLVLLMHHTRRVFGHFAKAEIFVLSVIGHVRSVGLWLIVSFFANIAGHVALAATGLIQGHSDGTAWPLVIGVVTFIAAYVMEEARRIADDNASIV